jgi:hypothetical protein
VQRPESIALRFVRRGQLCIVQTVPRQAHNPGTFLELADIGDAVEILTGCQVRCEEWRILIPVAVREGVIGSRGAVHGEMCSETLESKKRRKRGKDNNNVGGVAAEMRLLTL